MEENTVSKDKKKKHRKLNKKRFFSFLICLICITFCIFYLVTIRVKMVYITGTNYISDAYILRQTNLRNHPKYIEINTNDIIKKIENIPLVSSVKIKKHLTGTLKIIIEEEIPLLYLVNTNQVVTNKNKVYEKIDNLITLPTLKTSISKEAQELLVQALSKVDRNILSMISEVEYSPTISSNGNIIDDKRFTFYMNDGNIAIINTINIKKFNYYLKVVDKTIQSFGENVLGTYNFDSATLNVVFAKKESSEAKDDSKKEL